MEHMCKGILKNSKAAQEIYALWCEYEEATTKEALLVKDLDKFEMIVQALEYEQCKLFDCLPSHSFCEIRNTA
jgi:5'-deoxynucleotidase YfbR-like HD superfamily hydrolase